MTDNRHETTSIARPADDGGTLVVWDLLIRVVHWSLAGLFAVTFISEDVQWLHQPAGYAILALIGARVIWGIVGPQQARLARLVRPPREALGYLKGLLDGTAPRSLGHNPAGGWMALALLGMLTLCGLTGWLLTLREWGHDHWLSELHEATADAALVLVALHVIGVAASSLRHRENLIKAMITGRKRALAARDKASSEAR